MRNIISKATCITMLLFVHSLCCFSQDELTPQQQLNEVTADLKRINLEYTWKLAESYADYCVDNLKYISWNDLPYLRRIVETERPAELEPYRLESEECKHKLDSFLNKQPKYILLTELKNKATTEAELNNNKAAFQTFYNQLRKTDGDAYIPLYMENQKAACKYRAEALKYMVKVYRQNNKIMPISFIKYSDISELVYKGSELELMNSKIRILKNLQENLIKEVSNEKYGLKE